MRRMAGLFWVLLICLVPGVLIMAETISECAPAHEAKPEWLLMEATAYCRGEITADGSRVREGICAAKKEWIGLVAAVYLDEVKEDGSHGPGEFLGYYEIKDTGGNELIKNGQAIDIYNPSLEWCINFGRKNVWVKLTKGEG